jgi:hypothetical protein
MSEHVIGIYNSSRGGYVAECHECGHLVRTSRVGTLKNDITDHYRRSHRQHTVSFARYRRNRD